MRSVFFSRNAFVSYLFIAPYIFTIYLFECERINFFFNVQFLFKWNVTIHIWASISRFSQKKEIISYIKAKLCANTIGIYILLIKDN